MQPAVSVYGVAFFVIVCYNIYLVTYLDFYYERSVADVTIRRMQRIFAALCVLVFVFSTLPLYAIAVYNHPYYDDYGFSAPVHKVWKQTGDLGEVLKAAWTAARETRMTWQGNYTGTFLSNLQPGLFDESLYWVGSWFLLTALIGCVAFFLQTAFKRLGLETWARISLISLTLTLLLQLMPDMGEAFYWFNGGVGNTFNYGLIALAAALCIRLYQTPKRGFGLTALLAVLAVAISGGGYGGGLFALCIGAMGLLWLFVRKGSKRLRFTALYVLMAGCFLYSVSAPGNAVRAGLVGYRVSAAKTILQAFYFGIAQMGEYLRLPLIAITLPLLPAFYQAAKKSAFRFDHPWLALGLGVCLYCAQFAPPLYGVASIGDGRIIDTYFISFVVMWLLFVYYLAGYAARRTAFAQPTVRQWGAVLLVSLCLLGMGCQAYRRPGDALYGVQNLSGPSALLSILTGEAAQYDREMTQREVLLKDETQPVITLKPLTAIPAVFMEDLLRPDAVYDVTEVLCNYYDKQEICIAGGEKTK